MRRDWFRFDPFTLLATLLVGLVPAVILILISFLYLKSMSLPLYDLLRAPHRQGVVQRTDRLGEEFEAWRELLGRDLAGSLATPPDGATWTPQLLDWELVESIEWYVGPEYAPPDAEGSGERDRAEAILTTLGREADEGERQPSLAALASLPVTLQDPTGFSYAVEASLYRSEKSGSALTGEVVRHAGGLDRASLLAYLGHQGGEVRLPGLPRPILPRFEESPLSAGRSELPIADPDGLLLAYPAGRDGTLVCRVSARTLLTHALARLDERDPPSEGVFYRIEPIGAGGRIVPSEARERVWAERPLPPPFSRSWQLVSGSRGEALNPLSFLHRIEGIHYLWGGLLVLALGLVGSLFLSGLISRRVRLSRRKDDFVRLVSHELRTPIASLSMLAETLALDRVRDEAERQQFLEQMQTETGRLGDLVERVLEFGRSGTGRASVREVTTDPGELVEAVVERFRDRFPDGPRVEVRTAQQFHPVVLDREAVQGVVLNLLTNAQKHSPADSVIEVTVGEESRQLFIRVRDHGAGIRRRDQRRIFRPFERANPSSGKPGFGLGLAYCREVATAHRGSIRVRSKVGEGSEFTLGIPLVPAAKEQGTGE